MRNGKAANIPGSEGSFARRLRELRKQHGLSQAVNKRLLNAFLTRKQLQEFGAR